MKNWAWLLAQESTSQEGQPTGSQERSAAEGQTIDPDGTPEDEIQRQPGFFDTPGPILILMMIVMWFFLIIAPQRKKQKRHQQMMSNMKKNDRVQTIGGILGTVVDMRDQEIVIKIDESNNTKMHLARNAIARVLRDENETGKTEK